MMEEPQTPRKLVLEVKPTRLMHVEDFLLFADALRKQEVPSRDDVQVVITSEGFLRFIALLPPEPKKRVSRQKLAVEEQISERRRQVAAGEDVPGYVPPAKPKRSIKVKRKKAQK